MGDRVRGEELIFLHHDAINQRQIINFKFVFLEIPLLGIFIDLIFKNTSTKGEMKRSLKGARINYYKSSENL